MTLPIRQLDNVLTFKKKKLLFEIENHQELFALGKTFLSDIEAGVKSFGFSSLGYEMSQKRTVLGLACFFDYSNLGKVAIISDSFENNVFTDLIKHSRLKHLKLGNKTDFEVHNFADSFDLIELSSLLQTKNLETMDGLKQLLSSYDLVLWDLPPWHKLQKHPELYLSMILSLQSLSILVAPSLTREEEIKQAKNFFSNYGVSLKGFIMDYRTHDNNEKRVSGDFE